MYWKTLTLFCAFGLFVLSDLSYAETPREQAERIAREAMAKAKAEKEKNDRIVEKQRAEERRQKEAAEARRKARELEEAECRSRTC